MKSADVQEINDFDNKYETYFSSGPTDCPHNNIVMVRKRIYWEYFHWPALALKSSGMDWNTDGSVSFLARVWIVE